MSSTVSSIIKHPIVRVMAGFACPSCRFCCLFTDAPVNAPLPGRRRYVPVPGHFRT